MTNELEKQFFDTFGIEKRIEFETCYALDSPHTYSTAIKRYPQITDRILLELICMANQHENYPISTNIKNIQARTLRILLRTEKFYKNYYGSDGRYKKLVKQVRTLFEEG